MTPVDLQSYLHERIPLSAAMGVRVVSLGPDEVVLRAPLSSNINHRDTVFGGSASALAVLAAWSLVYVRLASTGRDRDCRIVIQRNTIDYDLPMYGEFSAASRLTDPDSWERFAHMLERRGRARVSVSCMLQSEGAVCGRFEGSIVAIRV